MVIKLIAGLGNPGSEYSATRHNAGAWLAAAIARQQNKTLCYDAKFQGSTGNVRLAEINCRLLIPTTFMNHSGQAIRAIAGFYQILPEEILIVHDELDLEPGVTRLKFDGGHGGHNGVRDIIAHLHTTQFWRLRLGIGHPGNSKLVSDYVLKNPTRDEYVKITQALEESIAVLPLIVTGETDKAMQYLHTL